VNGVQVTPESQRKLTISANEMVNIQTAKLEKAFTFIRCRFPFSRIGRLHAFDPTVSEFIIQASDIKIHFRDFLSLRSGDHLNLTKENCSLLIAKIYDMTLVVKTMKRFILWSFANFERFGLSFEL
jgi:hypothetical protein